jgi:hypothetical protein
MTRHRVPRVEVADVRESRVGKRELKKRKVRAERRAAKKDPETPASYGRYCGWQS